ncbi:HlyD family type I secretion periplasmic adaptor subunit [Geomesophilobacter sediminis]|uniref:HlyD family type I secretion periplasmic adaptor subunit n=1 Tax=Geomesophilobacter sediminis TaxID=2798584 RepID=A0A8J7M393_9BACT|nr:HlyD family type I secretion periplasmic adaptor subunit [Geomesophilobacter sediminis]MBJ6727428.1 HlyD family type I secretion periplasmic adaptor subunit [Geomesophilobacter sediminis]
MFGILRKKEPQPEPASVPQLRENSLPAAAGPNALVLSRSRDALEREAAMSPRPAILAGMGILLFFFAGVLIWVLYVPLRAAISAPAEIVFKSKRQAVQHLEGGIIKEILVKDGDMVQAGQPLIKLETTQVAPLVNMLEEQNLAEVAAMARLDAESKDMGSVPYPKAMTDRANDPAVQRVIQSENRLFAARRAAFSNQVQLIKLQISEIRESMRGTQERLAAKKQEMASLKQQLDANMTLQKQGYVTNTVVLDLQRAMASYAGEREMLSASIASDRQRIAEMEQRMIALRTERIQGAINEMRQSAMRRIDQQERVRPLRDTLERQVIRAPVTGRVVGLKVATVGGVVQPRETIMEIAPVGDHLILEAKVKVEDIGEISVGQLAEVRIMGLDPRNTPDIRAKVTYLSDDRLIPQNSPNPQPYYAAVLEFDPTSIKQLDKNVIKPGMSASVAIGTKPHSPFDYIMAPLRHHIQKALTTR